MLKELELKDFMNGASDSVSIRQKLLGAIDKKEKKTRIAFITPNVIGSATQAKRV